MKEKLLDILEKICEDNAVRDDLDLDLFEEDLLDSLGFAELLVSIEEEFGIIIAPSEVEREDINTVNKMISLIQSRS